MRKKIGKRVQAERNLLEYRQVRKQNLNLKHTMGSISSSILLWYKPIGLVLGSKIITLTLPRVHHEKVLRIVSQSLNIITKLLKFCANRYMAARSGVIQNQKQMKFTMEFWCSYQATIFFHDGSTNQERSYLCKRWVSTSGSPVWFITPLHVGYKIQGI